MKQKLLLTLCIATLSMIFSENASAQNSSNPTEEAIKNLKPYPLTIDTLERHVIFLDQKNDESLYKVEIFAGKNMEVDCNLHRLTGNFKEGVVDGWGYGYYTFNTNEHVLSTMMACPAPKTVKFVSGESTLTRYNSRLPLVVYLPKGMSLKYKIWTAGEEQFADKK